MVWTFAINLLAPSFFSLTRQRTSQPPPSRQRAGVACTSVRAGCIPGRHGEGGPPVDSTPHSPPVAGRTGAVSGAATEGGRYAVEQGDLACGCSCRWRCRWCSYYGSNLMPDTIEVFRVQVEGSIIAAGLHIDGDMPLPIFLYNYTLVWENRALQWCFTFTIMYSYIHIFLYNYTPTTSKYSMRRFEALAYGDFSNYDPELFHRLIGLTSVTTYICRYRYMWIGWMITFYELVIHICSMLSTLMLFVH